MRKLLEDYSLGNGLLPVRRQRPFPPPSRVAERQPRARKHLKLIVRILCAHVLPYALLVVSSVTGGDSHIQIGDTAGVVKVDSQGTR